MLAGSTIKQILEYIRREVTVAGESHKVVIPFRIENAEPKVQHGERQLLQA